MADIEEVGLDWRFEIPLEAARITLRELKRFYDEGTKHFDAEFAKLEMRAKNTSPDGDDESDYLSDLMNQLEGILDLKQEFGIIGIYRTFERFLRIVENKQREAGVVISGQTAPYLDQLKDQFKEIGVELTQPPFQWREIKKLQEIRNCIAHHEGWVDEKNASILRSYQLSVKENDWLDLPKDYFLEALKLVDKTCELVIDKCREATKTATMSRMN